VQLSEAMVEVHEPKPQVQAFVPPPAATQPKIPSGPDRATLESALNGYKNVFKQASGKSGKDCKSVFSGTYQGKLNAWARWCDLAKSFDVTEQCSQVGGSPDAPTLTCAESLTVRLKDGDPSQTHSQRTFQFEKNSDGSWRVSGWQ
jgi:hypothetical protein